MSHEWEVTMCQPEGEIATCWRLVPATGRKGKIIELNGMCGLDEYGQPNGCPTAVKCLMRKLAGEKGKLKFKVGKNGNSIMGTKGSVSYIISEGNIINNFLGE